jgi:DNA-binding transcriptional LysR family regulator
MTPTVRQIRYFVATAEHGQVSQAAVDLSISQSAITTAIKELENAVGTDLFVRTAHGMELTSTGREFLFHANDILSKLKEAMAVQAPCVNFEGSLNVAATYTVLGYFLPHHIDRLARVFPRLEIQLFEMTREAIEEGLLTHRYDVAVILTSNNANPDIMTETLLSSKRRLWLPAKHRLLSRDNVGLKEVAEEPYIMLTVDEAAHTALRYWSRTPYRPQVKFRTSSTEAVRSMVANGHGVAILSDMVHRPWSLEGKRIETMVPSDPVPSMDIGLAWRRSVDFTPAMDAFRNYFRRTFSMAHQTLGNVL